MLVIWLIVAVTFCGAMVVWVMAFGTLVHDLWLMEHWRTLANKVYPRSRRNLQRSLSKIAPSQNVSPPPAGRRLTEQEQRSENAATARQVRVKLLQLLHYDRAALDGLMGLARKEKPGMTQLWYLEKVLVDLERDRFR